jgi:hypothetical protein
LSRCAFRKECRAAHAALGNRHRQVHSYKLSRRAPHCDDARKRYLSRCQGVCGRQPVLHPESTTPPGSLTGVLCKWLGFSLSHEFRVAPEARNLFYEKKEFRAQIYQRKKPEIRYGIPKVNS